MKKKKIMENLKKRYSKKDFFEGKLWRMEYLFLDGLISPQEALEIAKRKGLKAIAITDHNTLLEYREAKRIEKKYKIIIIPAIEISTSQGEILAYGIKEKIPMHLPAQKTIDLIHSQGGVAIAAHPFSPKHKNPDFARIDESYIRNLNFDGVETFSPFYGKNRYWERLTRELKLAEIGGSDAHVSALVGRIWTEFPNYCQTEKDFIEAIKKRETRHKK